MNKVLGSTEHDNVYRGIEFDTKYRPIGEGASKRQVTKTENIPMLAGEWTLDEIWDYGEPLGKMERTAQLYLEQEGRTLRGYVETGYLFNDQRDLVSQEISGYIRDNKIELVATSYQLLTSPEDSTNDGWNLDTWRGQLENAESFSGEVFDKKLTGTFVATKVKSKDSEQKNPQNVSL